MREILFRGKTKDGKWFEGNGIVQGQDCISYARWVDICDDRTRCEVLPETVGRYTGLQDNNGKKIFEGDIVTGRFLHSLPINSVIAFRNGAFGLLWDRAGAETFDAFTSLCNIEYEVVGNIHDNPELLEQER